MKLPHEFLLRQLGFEAWAQNIVVNCLDIDPSVACLEWRDRGVDITYRDGTWTIRAHDGSGWKTYQYEPIKVAKEGDRVAGTARGRRKAIRSQVHMPPAGDGGRA